jgi:hypothetical protein
MAASRVRTGGRAASSPSESASTLAGSTLVGPPPCRIRSARGSNPNPRLQVTSVEEGALLLLLEAPSTGVARWRIHCQRSPGSSKQPSREGRARAKASWDVAERKQRGLAAARVPTGAQGPLRRRGGGVECRRCCAGTRRIAGLRGGGQTACGRMLDAGMGWGGYARPHFRCPLLLLWWRRRWRRGRSAARRREEGCGTQQFFSFSEKDSRGGGSQVGASGWRGRRVGGTLMCC